MIYHILGLYTAWQMNHLDLVSEYHIPLSIYVHDYMYIYVYERNN